MPDITMCLNNNCPRKTRCYRYCAVPSDWQSFAHFEHKECENFREIPEGARIEVPRVRMQLPIPEVNSDE